MKVTMINSVGEHAAGETVDLDDETGNRYVVLGYASTMDPVLAFTDEERAEILASNQNVSV